MTRYELIANMPYRLISFLIKNMSLTKYVNNVLKNDTNYSIKTIKIILKSEYAISLLFHWHKTPEGYEYWSTMNELFYKQIWQQK